MNKTTDYGPLLYVFSLKIVHILPEETILAQL